MPRPRSRRRIRGRVDSDFFKPRGKPLSETRIITLTKEEFEAIRLRDYECLDQNDSAERMEVSQSTFHRVYADARKKLARAIVEGNAIEIS
ncbi:MAG: DUF134 domain-containing protein [Nanobdellota archaeon]